MVQVREIRDNRNKQINARHQDINEKLNSTASFFKRKAELASQKALNKEQSIREMERVE